MGGASSSEGDSAQPWLTARSSGWHTARSAPPPDGWQPAHSGGSGAGSAGWQARAAAAGWRSSSSQEGSESGAASSRQRLSEQPLPQSGGAPQAVVAELQLLRISSRSSSPTRPGPGGRTHSRGGSRCGSASLSDVVQQTYPPEAVERLERLRQQLSPGRQQHTASPPQVSERTSAGGSTRSGRSPGQSAAAASGPASSGVASGGSRGSSRRGSPTQQLPRRCDSPELPSAHHAAPGQAAAGVGGGLPILGLSRCLSCCSGSAAVHTLSLPGTCGPAHANRTASAPPTAILAPCGHCLRVQSAVGRMPGNPGESADAAAIQEALMDVLSGWTLHVQVCPPHLAQCWLGGQLGWMGGRMACLHAPCLANAKSWDPSSRGIGAGCALWPAFGRCSPTAAALTPPHPWTCYRRSTTSVKRQRSWRQPGGGTGAMRPRSSERAGGWRRPGRRRCGASCRCLWSR